MPLAIVAILCVNFLLIHSVQDSLLKPTKGELEMDDICFQANGFSEDDFSKEYGLNLPLILNTWPWMKTSTLKKKIDLKELNLPSIAPYTLRQLRKIYLKGPDDFTFKLIAMGQMKKISRGIVFEQNKPPIEQTPLFNQLEDLLLHQDSMTQDPWVLPDEKSSWLENIQVLFFKTRLACYVRKLVSLDFGTLRYQSDQKVCHSVIKRLKTSGKLLVVSLILTWAFSHLLGLIMALKMQKWSGRFLTIFCSLLYATPLYIMIPFLIEKLGIGYQLPFYNLKMERLSEWILPMIALTYGGIAIYSKLSAALFTQLFCQEHLLVAKAKGLQMARLIWVHTLRQAIITTTPLLLGSISFFMGSLVVVETLFEIDGFGSFFYQAILQKDTNVLIFSTLILSLLSLGGYFLADLFLYQFDPRIRRHVDQRVFKAV